MAWLLNLLMLGKGPPPNLTNFTRLSCNAVSGKPYNIQIKLESGTEVGGLVYFLRHLCRVG